MNRIQQSDQELSARKNSEKSDNKSTPSKDAPVKIAR